MKKILIIALAAIGLIVLTGCNNDNDVNRPVIDPGEKITVEEKVTLNCGQPFIFHAVSQYESNVTVELPEEDPIEYAGLVGVDVKYSVVSDCEQAQVPIKPTDGECPADYVLDENVDMCFPKKAEEVPVPDCNGECPEGYKLNDCNTCVKLPCVTCGEGTVLDKESNSCLVAPEETHPCGEGTEWDEETETCVIETEEPK